MSACPSINCTERRSALFCTRCEAKAWRSTCGLTRSALMPAATATPFRSRRNAGASDGRSRRRTETARARTCPARLREQSETGLHRLLGDSRQRHEPLFEPLPTTDRNRPPAGPPSASARRARHPQARGIERSSKAVSLAARSRSGIGRPASSMPSWATASRRSTSSTDSTFGRARPRFGPSSVVVGSSVRNPSA